MKQKRLKIISKCFADAVPTMTLKKLYDSSKLNFSYKTFFRGAMILAEKELIKLEKISYGRGTGVNIEIRDICFNKLRDFQVQL